MNTEDAVVLLSAAPATAYREYLYRPHGRLGRWMSEWFDVVAGPGQNVSQQPQAGDVLIEVALGRPGFGRCVTLAADALERVASLPRLATGQLLLRPRGRVQVSEPLPVEPVTGVGGGDGGSGGDTRSGGDTGSSDTGDTGPAGLTGPGLLPPAQVTGDRDTVAAEHDFGGGDIEASPPVQVDREAAVPPFSPPERATVAEPLLSARESAKAVAWNRRMHPGVSGVTLGEIRDALQSYVDPAAVQAAIDRRNKEEPSDPIDASSSATDAVLAECIHQFQKKCYWERREHDGQAGESTLDSLGLIVRPGSGFRGADRGNATAQQRLNKHDADIKAITREFSAANWVNGMTDPSVFGWRTKSGHGLHVLLTRKLRRAERYLLTLPSFRGKPPAALGRALGLREQHGGARPTMTGSASVHTFGLAIDIAYRANPWVRDPASWQALQRAALLVSGMRLTQKSAPEYFSSLGSNPARSTGQIWDELYRRNAELITYFKLGDDATALRTAIVSGRERGTAGLVTPGEQVDQAVTRWHNHIQQDRENLARGDFRGHEPPETGFLTLPRDLVIALRDHGCLAWGAVDLGPGARGSGDMMHFDARIDGVGRILAQGTNYVPATGHPCFTESPPAGEAAPVPDLSEGEPRDYLGGRLWTFTARTLGLTVAVFCPQAALSAETAGILVFAHGLLGGCPRPAEVPAGFVTDPPFALGRIVHASGRPAVLAVPLLDWGHPGGEGTFGKKHTHWHALASPDHLNGLIDEVLAEVGRVRNSGPPSLGEVIIAGHSRAYDFLEPLAYSRMDKAMQEGGLAHLSQVWAFDTTYAGKVERWTSWLKVNPRLRIHIFYRPGSKTEAVGDEFYRERKARLAVTPVSEGHCAVPARRMAELLNVSVKADSETAEERGPAVPEGPDASPPAIGAESDGGAPGPTAQPTAEELTARIARCIGIWETNRGKNNPAPKESSLDTVAGVHASMATIEQATMPYAITALRQHKALRDKASPPLTMKELNAADARAAAVPTLLSAVAAAWSQGRAPDDFIAANRALIGATGLSDDDVRTMFRAEGLKNTLATARASIEAAERAARDKAALENKSGKEQAAAARSARQSALKAAIDAIPATDRLGLGEGSLRAYINTAANWGENRAAWQRKAVANMPDNVGGRIEAVAISDHGTALAIPTIRSRVDAELAKVPVPSTEDIVKTVAQKNNPHEPDYGLHVWQTYHRLYP